MAFRKNIRNRRGRRRLKQGFELQLTSMMDVLVIILVFLLKSYATSATNLSTVPGIELPVSASQDSPLDTLQVIVTPDSMTFENERILDFVHTAADVGETSEATYAFKPSDLGEGGRLILPLYDALMKARQKSEVLREKSKARDAKGNPLPFQGQLAIQADKKIEYDTLRRIMYTSGAAGYRIFRFIALKRDG